PARSPAFPYTTLFRSRPLTGLCGSTLAAAQVTHCCAVIEAELRATDPRGQGPSANLIRALVVHGARRNERLERWMAEGHGPADRSEEHTSELQSLAYL